MTRRTFVQSAFQSAAFATQVSGRRPPNIVFLLTDDQRWDSLGCYGNGIVQTPHIDSLARSGVRFANSFVTTAICMSSRASIFTGLYTRNHRVERFDTQFTAAQFARTYPGLLRAAGYRTGFIGKWGLDKAPLPSQEFDYWRGFPGQGASFPQGESGPHILPAMTDQAREFLNTATPSQPFCLSVSFKHPHVDDNDPRQFLPEPRDRELYRDVTIPVPPTADPSFIRQLPAAIQRSESRRRWAVRFGTPELYQESVKNYYRLCTGIDRSVGAMLDSLRSIGLADNTVVVYASDNGFYLGEHGLAGKWYMHEESIRVPLIIHDPRPGATRGLVRNQMVLNIDIAPTLVALAGIQNPLPMQGRSLVPLLGPASPAAWRKEFFYEHRFRNNGWIPATEGIRTERLKYTRYIDESPVFEELFDLTTDPQESRNLARQSTELSALRQRHQVWTKALETWAPDRPWSDPA